MGLALAVLLLSKAQLRLPRIWLPLGLFLLVTLISLLFSGDMAAGLPQVRKIYVYSMLLLAFSLFRELRVIRWLVVSWAGVGALVAARAIVQFFTKLSEARALGMNFYEYYEPERITGFMSHWMTFGGAHSDHAAGFRRNIEIEFSTKGRERSSGPEIECIVLAGRIEPGF